MYLYVIFVTGIFTYAFVQVELIRKCFHQKPWLSKTDENTIEILFIIIS